jgi:hypothetical protein
VAQPRLGGGALLLAEHQDRPPAEAAEPGYRKAVRLMETADRFGLPVIAFVDTAGAYPGIEAAATLGTPSAKQASVERAMASAWPRSSASMPG